MKTKQSIKKQQIFQVRETRSKITIYEGLYRLLNTNARHNDLLLRFSLRLKWYHAYSLINHVH